MRASDYVAGPDDVRQSIGELADTRDAGDGWCQAATYQRRADDAFVTLVIGQDPPLPPPHQRGPAEVQRRDARADRRAAHVRSKPQPPTHDRVWALLTSATTVAAARERYAQRCATEGTDRDLKSGERETVAGQTTDAEQVDGLLGLASLADLCPMGRGVLASQTDDPLAWRRQPTWSTTDRLSPFWRGRQVLHDHAFDGQPWMVQAIDHLGTALAVMPPLPIRHHVTRRPRAEAA